MTTLLLVVLSAIGFIAAGAVTGAYLLPRKLAVRRVRSGYMPHEFVTLTPNGDVLALWDSSVLAPPLAYLGDEDYFLDNEANRPEGCQPLFIVPGTVDIDWVSPGDRELDATNYMVPELDEDEVIGGDDA